MEEEPDAKEQASGLEEEMPEKVERTEERRPFYLFWRD
jgi:hypothetical protein